VPLQLLLLLRTTSHHTMERVLLLLLLLWTSSVRIRLMFRWSTCEAVSPLLLLLGLENRALHLLFH